MSDAVNDIKLGLSLASTAKVKSLTHIDGVTCSSGAKCDYCDDGDTYMPAMGATSLDGLVAARDAQQQTYALQTLAGDFSGVVSNIVASPLIEDKGAAIAEQAGLFQQMVNAISAGAKSLSDAISKRGARHSKTDNEAVQSVHDMAVQLGAMCAGKSKSAFGVCKGLDGNYYGLGVFTNCYEDLDKEIITDAAHKEFSAWLDANPTYAPELWTEHEEGTARKSRANLWDYDGTFFWMQWPLTVNEAKALATVGPLTMSHQFNGVKDGNEWVYYRSFEASVLNHGEEANPLTSFETVAKERLAMFTPEKRALMVALHGEEFTAEKERISDKARKDADALGTRRKEVDAVAVDSTTTTPVVETTTPTPTIDNDALVALTNAVTTLAEIVQEQGKALKALQGDVSKSDEQRYASLFSPRPPTVGIAQAAKTVAGDDGVNDAEMQQAIAEYTGWVKQVKEASH